MCNFSTLDDDAKRLYHQQLISAANAFGGINFFLQLLEAIRESSSHPLNAKNSAFHCSLGSIKWNKAIYPDKVALLTKVRVTEDGEYNILPSKESKEYKKIRNLVRTLKPLEFTIKPEDPKDGEGFVLRPFSVIGDDSTELNPLFDAIFFCSVESVKKGLNYKM